VETGFSRNARSSLQKIDHVFRLWAILPKAGVIWLGAIPKTRPSPPSARGKISASRQSHRLCGRLGRKIGTIPVRDLPLEVKEDRSTAVIPHNARNAVTPASRERETLGVFDEP
jgi:hypothetical protein